MHKYRKMEEQVPGRTSGNRIYRNANERDIGGTSEGNRPDGLRDRGKPNQADDEAERRRIHIPHDLLGDEIIVGVYGFFAIREDEEYCFYIGKATNMAGRLFSSSNGHVYFYLNNNNSKLVTQKIKEYLENNYEIKVKILDKIDYHDSSFSKAAHRLALAELQKIVQYQEQGQCEFQFPEGCGKNEENFGKQL